MKMRSMREVVITKKQAQKLVAEIEELKTALNLLKEKTVAVTRLEVIDHTAPIAEGGGRSVLFWDDEKQVDIEIQDEGRTLKVFIHERYDENL